MKGHFAIVFVFMLISMGRIFGQSPASIKLSDHEVNFELKQGEGRVFSVMNPGYPFSGKKNAIIKVAPSLLKLHGIRAKVNVLHLNFKTDARVLMAMPLGQKPTEENAKLYISSGLTITGMPPFDIYSVLYKRGMRTVSCGTAGGFIVGVIEASQKLPYYNVKMPDGSAWRPYITDGLMDGKALFEMVGGSDSPVINEGMPGTAGIQGGFEGGTCVKVNGIYHLFPTERAGEATVGPQFDRVKTRIGHWQSPDAIHWQRVNTIYQASGTYAVADDDNPMNDRRAAIWSYNAVFNQKEDRWYGYYLTYTVDKNIAPNHSFGRIWRTKSETKGMGGIGGPYGDGQLIMEPGLSSQLWEGRQGVASFYPFPVKDGWLAFYAGAYPFLTRADYPDKSGTGWFIGLAKSKTMDGPWQRLDTTINPVKSINPEFIENPLVYKLKEDAYIVLFDGGPDDKEHHFVGMMGYALSKDGLHWSEARYLPIQTKIKKWWSTMRTPLCLIPEGDDVYTILFAAINGKRFHPIGRVQVKMDTGVLDALLSEPQCTGKGNIQDSVTRG